MMVPTKISKRMESVIGGNKNIFDFFAYVHGEYAERDVSKTVGDFMLGNPQEKLSSNYAQALCNVASSTEFTYTSSAPEATELVVKKLVSEHKFPSYCPNDVIMTTGGFAGLSAAMACLVDEGDEVIFLSPPWFFYKPIILFHGGIPVPVYLKPENQFQLPIDQIESLITPKTKAIILNSPHNPTGKVFSLEELQALANLLEKHPSVWVLHDAVYFDIVFDQLSATSFALLFPRAMIIYSWGKITLAPGQRIGFMALSPLLDPTERQTILETLRFALLLNFAHPASLAQQAITEIDTCCRIQVSTLQSRRDLLYSQLSSIGYHIPLNSEGTFYLLVLTPGHHLAAEAVRLLFERHVYVLDGSLFELPHYFRVCLTATDEMCSNSIPVFRQVYSLLTSAGP